MVMMMQKNNGCVVIVSISGMSLKLGVYRVAEYCVDYHDSIVVFSAMFRDG